MHKTSIQFSLFTLGILLLLSSCGVNSNIMFKTPKGSEYKYDSIPARPTEDYRISRDDKFTFTLSTKGGHKIIENMSGVAGASTSEGTSSLEYLVRADGKANLPVIGDVHVQGLTVQSCEDTLARLYSTEYQDPFVQVQITNQRVIVFPGNGGDAKVIPLQNNNTTLMEAIAAAGGITERGRANRIKLMRVVPNEERAVYLLDLSTIEGLASADMIVQANDYIYIEPNARLGREVLTQVVPFISIISSALVIFTVVNTLK
jgi:polysaccharide export outer membrane protein